MLHQSVQWPQQLSRRQHSSSSQCAGCRWQGQRAAAEVSRKSQVRNVVALQPLLGSLCPAGTRYLQPTATASYGLSHKCCNGCLLVCAGELQSSCQCTGGNSSSRHTRHVFQSYIGQHQVDPDPSGGQHHIQLYRAGAVCRQPSRVSGRGCAGPRYVKTMWGLTCKAASQGGTILC